ncbi:putative signal transduction protein [Phaeomoniella chlamydospora]|uniref:Putative signal transduction protein n=1 Tax=Phaeomoniella chlamydospora TaxID=158046 RepID=A0A0G2GL24_PHACM|nr:putative signal transduction protein [Phaeomoniella chlamydospora]
MFSTAGVETSPGTGDVKLHAYRELDAKQDDFFDFLDSELRKIEEFYKMKENEASERLQLLRGQLHEMRDRRLAELSVPRNGGYSTKKSSIVPDKEERNGILSRAVLSKSLEETFSKRRIGKTSAAMSKLASPPKPAPQDPESQRDYTRRPQQDGVQYRVAKRKLKLAMQEFYRGLELLKSYALLNRTAFRKMNKKYDKAVNARPTQRYMSEKVNKSWFVQSEVIEGYIVAVEDLYARYFERGNRKIAVGKLRSKTARTGAYTANTFRNGLLLAAGLVLGIEGLVNATHDVFSTNPVLVTQASYLLQIYGGYFLALFLFLLFVLDCRVWSKAKINYVFIFEYDTRHVLDWRQLGELPCLFFFFLGLFLYLNFHQYGLESMYIWWPVVLIALTMAIMLYPARVLYHHSRQWWAYSNWRLLLAGLYPVEFRDFFLGDMFCSQTYAMGNIELFFCLYANDWGNPPQCNSSHSRLLGFFSTLPAVWRALQCLRRYYDSRNWFPHLVNCGKYGFNILFYMSLSLYRVHRAQELRIVFILFATINAIYCSIWDLAMDWSLLNPYARYPLLRNTLGYRRVWIYYAAMVLDPVLRFNWIFYAIFTNELQHSAFLSFFVAFSEILRRGMWTLFRVENEHCTNVGRFRASRDIPLPYSLPVSSKTSAQPSPRITEQQEETAPTETTGADIERVASVHGGSLRMRKSRTLQHVAETPTLRGLQRVGTIITQAHAQDFEKKRRPGVTGDTPSSRGLMARGGESSEEEDEDDEEDNDGGTDAVETDENSSDLDVDEAEEAVDRPQSPRAGSSSVTQ